MTRSYYRQASILVLVFDIHNKEWENGVNYFIQMKQEEAPQATLVIVGNKMDLSLLIIT